MGLTAEALKGYLLEEALAYLIRNTGYKLLVDEAQDKNELKNGPNGLLVRGRGSFHQVDVLGELNWVPAFTYPIRLFVEAKFRTKRTGIYTVRNAIGVLNDINQNLLPSNNGEHLVKRYSYNYALFSTSGFTKYAIDLALAHGISLIDLSDCGLDSLLETISASANTITSMVNEDTLANSPNRKIYTQIRSLVRRKLETYPENLDRYLENEFIYSRQELASSIDILVEGIKHTNELLVATAKGPFIIVLAPMNFNNFITYAKEHPKHDIHISWNSGDNNGRSWTVKPLDGLYSLKFKLPEALAKNIFSNTDYLQRALDIKADYFSELTIFHITDQQDYIFRLKFVLNGF